MDTPAGFLSTAGTWLFLGLLFLLFFGLFRGDDHR